MRESVRCDLLDVARGLETGCMRPEDAASTLRELAGVMPDRFLHMATVSPTWMKRLRGTLTRLAWHMGGDGDWLVPAGGEVVWVPNDAIESSVAAVGDVPWPSANKPESCSSEALYEVVVNGYQGIGWRFRGSPPEWAVYTPRLGFHMRNDDTVVPVRPALVARV